MSLLGPVNIEQIIYFIVLCISFIIVHKSFKLTNLINPFVLFFIYQSVFFYIALFYSNNYVRYGIVISPTVKLFVVYAYIMTVVGALIALLLFRKNKNCQEMLNELTVVDDNNMVDLHSAFILLFFGYFCYLVFFLKSGFVPFGSADMETARIVAKKGAGTISILAIVFTTYSSLFIFFHKKTFKIVKGCVFIVSVIVLLGFGSRAPLLKFFFYIFVLFLINRKIKLRLYHMALFGGGLFCLMVLLGALRKGFDINIMRYVEARFAWRPFVSIMTFDRIYKFFSPGGTLFGGSYWIELKTLLPGYQPNFGTWVKEALGLMFEGGSVTSSYLGVAYINFGLAGILAYPFFYGLSLQSLYLLFLNTQKLSLAKLILFLEISFSLWGVSTVGIATPILYFVVPFIVVYKVHAYSSYGLRKALGFV